MFRIRTYIVVFGIALFYSCNTGDDFTNTLISETSNKNGVKAVVFYKTGDATTPDSYQISLLNENEQFSQQNKANTFSCKDNGKATVLVKWISKDSLLIEYIRSATTYIKESKVNGVNLLYKEK
ncbi:hypothetical protein [Ferruginibacter sp.]